MANDNLSRAKSAKNDEFYTQYPDIQAEMNAYYGFDRDVFRGKTVLLPCDDPEWSEFTRFFAQNFSFLGLKKLISTSYAFESKNFPSETRPVYQASLFETESVRYDADKSKTHGKLFVLDHDANSDGVFNVDDLEWDYLEGDGDFRSEEVTRLRDEADVIVTNPPFSLFREFLAWVVEGGKEFALIGNMNAITYKEVFPLIMENKIWLGNGFSGGNAYFRVEGDDVNRFAEGVYNAETNLVKFRNCTWFTNIEHKKRHEPLQLMTMAENLRYNKKVIEKGYPRYDNYDAIEVSYTDAIPSDYPGVMGVPISFLAKYNPDQFEILGVFNHGKDHQWDLAVPEIDGVAKFKRIAIRHRRR